MSEKLTTTDHNREIAGLQYIYPVISRRAGGLSIGINLNTNKACNWRCLYCQVPGLSKGAAPAIDFPRLERELRWFLQYVLVGSFYADFDMPEQQRCIKDIAISGNGEPTSARGFAHVITLLTEVLAELQLTHAFNKVLITNGSLVHRTEVQQGLRQWHAIGGEVWFKLDSATTQGRRLLNNSRLSNAKVLSNLRLAASLCTTKIQTCVLQYLGDNWPAGERAAYLDLLRQLTDIPNLRSIMLYSIARPSYQPEAPLLQAMPVAEMQAFARELEQLGFQVSVSV